MPEAVRLLLRHAFARNVSPDLDQGRVRLAVGAVIVASVWIAHLKGYQPVRAHEAVFATVAIGYLVFSIAFLWWSVIVPQYSLRRRLISLVADTVAPTVCLSLLGEAGASLWWMLLFVATGHGFRFGYRWLIASQVLGILGFVMVVIVNPYWHDHELMTAGVALSMVLLPLYSVALLRRLNDAHAALEEASAARSRFFAMMSHDLRTPIHGVLGANELLLGRSLADEERDLVWKSQMCAESMLALVNDILDLAKREGGALEREHLAYDPVATIAGAMRRVAPIADRAGLRIALVVDGRIPRWAIGAPSHTTRVLGNLLGNAVKFTSAGGITVRAGLAGPERDRLRIEVADTGIGIPEAALARIFDRFYQVDDALRARYGGTGLGTAIAKEFVELMGGTIGVRSTLGKGSTFWFEVPIEPATEAAPASPLQPDAFVVCVHAQADGPALNLAALAEKNGLPVRLVANDAWRQMLTHHQPQRTVVIVDPAHRPAEDTPSKHPCVLVTDTQDAALQARPVGVHTIVLAASSVIEAGGDAIATGVALAAMATPKRDGAPQPLRTLRVLVCDDNPTNRFIATQALRRHGHEVVACADGDEALAHLAEHDVDCVLLDWQMPGRDGLEVVRALRLMESPSRRTPVLLHTAETGAEIEQRARIAGADGVLPKPVSGTALLDAIGKVLRAQPAMERC